MAYNYISGPELPEVLDVPRHLANVVARRVARSGLSSGGSGRDASFSGSPDLSAGGPFEKFLAAVTHSGRIVKRVPRKSGEAFVQCPGAGHPDGNRNRPCLHVTARGNGIGLHCFGGRGCTVEEIVVALGLTKADLYDDLSGLKIIFVP